MKSINNLEFMVGGGGEGTVGLWGQAGPMEAFSL